MKKGWQTKRLADLCEVFADGDWIESKDQSPKGIRLIQTGNVGEGVFNDRREKARHVSVATFKRLRCTEIFEGDCLISRLPDPVGRSCILPDTGERMITAVDCTIVRFDRAQLTPYFFVLYSQTLDYLKVVEAEATGTTRKRISRNKLGQVTVPVPPLPEQQRIIGIVEKIFEGIAKAKEDTEQNLQNARALFESHLQSVFTQRGEGWDSCPFEQCIEDVTYTKKIKRKQFLKEGDFTVVSQEAEFTNGYWDNAADVFKVRRPVVIFGDHTKVLKYIDFDFVLGADGVKILSPRQFLVPKFFYYHLRSVPLKSLGYSRHYRLLKGVRIHFPDKDRQTEIIKKLDGFDREAQRLESIYQKKLTALEELKKSVLQKAFSGEL